MLLFVGWRSKESPTKKTGYTLACLAQCTRSEVLARTSTDRCQICSFPPGSCIIEEDIRKRIIKAIVKIK